MIQVIPSFLLFIEQCVFNSFSEENMTVKGAVELSKNPGRDVKKIEVNLEEALDLAGKITQVRIQKFP